MKFPVLWSGLCCSLRVGLEMLGYVSYGKATVQSIHFTSLHMESSDEIGGPLCPFCQHTCICINSRKLLLNQY